MKALFLAVLFIPLVGIKAEVLKKTAVFFLPEQIECKAGGGAQLIGEVGFRWDESEPLYLSLLQDRRSGKDQVVGAIQVYDEEGRELDKVIYVTVPPMPDKEIVVHKNEVKRFEVWELYSTVIFPRPGNYYAIASFDYGVCAKESVSFTTGKRWFRVIEPPVKKSAL